MRVGKVAIESELHIACHAIDGMMELFDRAGSRRDLPKRFVELCEVLDLDDDVEFAHLARSESEFAARQAMPRNPACLAESIQILIDALAKIEIRNIGPQIAPDVVEVHRLDRQILALEDRFESQTAIGKSLGCTLTPIDETDDASNLGTRCLDDL